MVFGRSPSYIFENNIEGHLSDVDQDVMNLLSLIGEDIGPLHAGQLVITDGKEFEKFAKVICPETELSQLRFTAVYSDTTQDDKANLTRVVQRTHLYNVDVFLPFDKFDQQLSYIERRRVTQKFMDHIASYDRFGEYIDVISPASVTSTTQEFHRNLVYVLEFQFTVTEPIARLT